MFDKCYRRGGKGELGTCNRGIYPNPENQGSSIWRLFTLRMKGNKTKPGEGKGGGDELFQEEYTASTQGQDRVTGSTFKGMKTQDCWSIKC